MLAIGLDVHQKRTALAMLDSDTGEVRERKVPTSDVPEFLHELSGEKRVVLEAGCMSAFIARQLGLLGVDVIVVDAFKSHRFAEALNTAKTDQLDALALARLAHEGAEELAVWVPDESTDDLRTVTRVRRKLVQQGTRLRNEIRGLIRHEGCRCRYSKLTGQAAQVWLNGFETQLPLGKRSALRQLRLALTDNVARIGELDDVLAELVKDCAAVQRLMTICGCGRLLAATIVAEIGDPNRFADASHLRSYTGLVPHVHQSGERQRTGRLTRRGNPFLRHALVMLAQHVAMKQDVKDTPLKRAYNRHLHRYGPNPAKVALARKLCDIILAMLRDGTDFDLTRLAA
jgi:transposase